MKVRSDIKAALQKAMYAHIEKQIESFLQAKNSIEESKLNETKSSAGDKYETGRAMIQMEQDKIESQLDQLRTLKNQLKQISTEIHNDYINKGALIITDNGHFYISISFGKMKVDANSYYTISPEAPLSKVMMGKKAGDQVNFRDRKYQILEVR